MMAHTARLGVVSSAVRAIWFSGDEELFILLGKYLNLGSRVRGGYAGSVQDVCLDPDD